MKVEKRTSGKMKRKGKLFVALTVAALMMGASLTGYAQGPVDKEVGSYYRGAVDAKVIIKDFSDFR